MCFLWAGGQWPYVGYLRVRKSQFCLRDPCATLGNPMKLGMAARDLFLMQNPKFEKFLKIRRVKLLNLLAPAAKIKDCTKKKL